MNYNGSQLNFKSLKLKIISMQTINGYFKKLSSRELQIALALVEEKSTKEISIIFGLKMNTVSTIKKSIYQKLNIRSVIGLYKLALKEGVI